ELSYRELNERADRWAAVLAGQGAGPEIPVAVLMLRSPELIVAILAIVKSGSYYVPLPAGCPNQRLQAIIEQLDRPLLVLDQAMLDQAMLDRGLPTGCRPVPVADLAAGGLPSRPGPGADPEQLAYLRFAVGSGKLAGVAVTHRNVLGLVADRRWAGAGYARTLMVAPDAFDMSSFELWMPLVTGRTIVLPPPGEVEVGTLTEVIARHQVSCVRLTQAQFQQVSEQAPAALLALRKVILTGAGVGTGDAIARVLAVCPGLVVLATYDATGTDLFSTCAQLTAPYRPGRAVPAGRALTNQRSYLLDELLRPAPEGELYLGGAGVARGYLRRPGLTAERLVPDPFVGGGARMYRTGVLARWAADGQLNLIGRAADQVRIRGFRVEPAEVESVLAGHPNVAHVSVAARDCEAGGKQLIAHLVPRPAGLDVAEVRRYAEARLPDYLVPAAFAIRLTAHRAGRSACVLRIGGSMNPFDDVAGEFAVVSNHEGQHCLWPALLPVPAGWTARFGPASRPSCLDYLAAEWTDLRPASLQSRLAIASTTAGAA
ncbi:MAG: AMP-binding protein, partial [Jatrophihabitantaceae bacterium]